MGPNIAAYQGRGRVIAQGSLIGLIYRSLIGPEPAASTPDAHDVSEESSRFRPSGAPRAAVSVSTPVSP